MWVVKGNVFSTNGNPYNVVQVPMYALASVETPDGLGNGKVIYFTYQDAVIHRGGRGFLGFKKITSVDNNTGFTSATENEINGQFFVPYTVKQATSLWGSELLKENTITTTFKNLSTGYTDKRYLIKIDKVLNVDYLNGTASEVSNTYDAFGNVTTSITKIGILSGSTVSPVETTTTSTSYGTYNSPVPARANSINTCNLRDGASQQSRTNSLTYLSSGLVGTQTEFSSQQKSVSTTFNYNSFGNLIQSLTSSAGLGNRIQKFTFDNWGRFATKKEWIGASINRSETFTYHTGWGKPLTHTSIDGLTTTFEYNMFGGLKKTIEPQGYPINHSLVWDIQGGNVFYSFTDYPGGKPDEKNWYDVLGRGTKKQTLGFNNQWLTQTTTYNAKGNVLTQSNTYYSSETPLITTFAYDNYNRPIGSSNTVTSATIAYTKLSGGKMQVVTTNAASQNKTQITDATGKTVTTIDNGGQLDFTYDSRGNQVQVIHESTVLISNSYDGYGRQTSLVDKNAGATTYEYDAYGQLSKQTDANGNTYNNSYDDLGRIITRQGLEGTTTYEYFVSGNYSNDNIQKVTGFNGVIKEYTYDNYRRLQNENVTVDGTSYNTSYTYDQYDNPLQTTYPSGVAVLNEYDANGILLTVKGGTSSSPITLFTGTQMNGFGQYTGYTLGNNKTGQNTYYYGTPTRFYTSGLQDLNFTFDFSRGNLTQRKDVVKNITEDFGYDNLNRLTTSTVNGTQQFAITYDGSASSSMGNIVSKTDAGSYVYRADKINAVAYITNPAGAKTPPANISTIQQDITYTPFLKTASIVQSPYQLDFIYGPDYQRIKSVLKQNGIITETKYYLGDYEKQVTNASTREIHYVAGGNGLCAIIVRENGVNSFYFVYTDYLGSLLTLTDINGTKVAEQNFDAWGRYRNPTNWQYTGVLSNPSWLYRGYTGHDHLSQFALINMNGRMYDPILGRMLSPDNFVPDPFNTQGYNRYGYANNNPLVYIDPDGNFWWVLVPIVVGAVTNVIDNWEDISKAFDDGFLKGIGKSLGYAAVGGAGGLVNYGLRGIPMLGNAASNIVTGVGNGLISGKSGGEIIEEVGKGILSGVAAGGISQALGPVFDKAGDWVSNKIGNSVIKSTVNSFVSNLGVQLTTNTAIDAADGDGFHLGDDIWKSLKSAALNAAVDAAVQIAAEKNQRKSAQQSAPQTPTAPPNLDIIRTQESLEIPGVINAPLTGSSMQLKTNLPTSQKTQNLIKRLRSAGGRIIRNKERQVIGISY